MFSLGFQQNKAKENKIHTHKQLRVLEEILRLHSLTTNSETLWSKSGTSFLVKYEKQNIKQI